MPVSRSGGAAGEPRRPARTGHTRHTAGIRSRDGIHPGEPAPTPPTPPGLARTLQGFPEPVHFLLNMLDSRIGAALIGQQALRALRLCPPPVAVAGQVLDALFLLCRTFTQRGKFDL